MANIIIYGGVIVNGKVYGDAEIAQLVGTDVGKYSPRTAHKVDGAGWDYAGDQFLEESCIDIQLGEVHHDFGEEDGLPRALAWLKTHIDLGFEVEDNITTQP